jgi:hypothetical protein
MSQTTWRRFFATFVAVASLTTVPILVDWIVKETSVIVASALSVVLAFALTWLIHLLIPNLLRRRASRREGQDSRTYEQRVKYLLFSFAPGNSIARSNAPTEPALKSLLQKSVEFFHPDELFLLVSSKSREEAEKLGEQYREKPCRLIEVGIDSVDGQRIHDEFLELIGGEEGIEFSKVVVDITGGTKSMSVSAYQFADSVGAIPVYSAPGGEGYIILSKT